MEPVEGAKSFRASGDAYDAYMGRYSRQLAPVFADSLGLAPGRRVLDVGCGPGALTGVLVHRLGVDAVAACDPSPPFVADCAARHPGLDVRAARAEALPFGEAEFDAAAAQLVLHFVTDAPQAASELRRVVRPGGVIGACTWDAADNGMELLRVFWEAAVRVDPDAPSETQSLRFGRAGELADLFAGAGLVDVDESVIRVSSTYGSFDELWSTDLLGIGPAGTYCVGLSDEQRTLVRSELHRLLDAPDGEITLWGTARSARGTVPS